MPLDPGHLDEIQHAVRLLTTALDTHEDALPLVNLWLANHGPWRLVFEPSALTLRKPGISRN